MDCPSKGGGGRETFASPLRTFQVLRISRRFGLELRLGLRLVLELARNWYGTGTEPRWELDWELDWTGNWTGLGIGIATGVGSEEQRQLDVELSQLMKWSTHMGEFLRRVTASKALAPYQIHESARSWPPNPSTGILSDAISAGTALEPDTRVLQGGSWISLDVESCMQ